MLGLFSLLINSLFLKHSRANFSILERHVSAVSSMGLFGIALQRAFPYPYFNEHVCALLIDQDPGESDSSRLQKMTVSTYSPPPPASCESPDTLLLLTHTPIYLFGSLRLGGTLS